MTYLTSVSVFSGQAHLHSGSTPFDVVKSSDWLPLFYESMEVLLKMMGEKLELLVDREEAKMAQKMVVAAKDDSAKAVAKSINAHQQTWNKIKAADQTKLANQSALWAIKQSGHRVKCPACKSDALVMGLPLAAPTRKLQGDHILVAQPYVPSKFECIACGLKIAGLPQLHAAGVGDVFTSTSVFNPTEFYGLSDEFAGYEDDNNEP